MPKKNSAEMAEITDACSVFRTAIERSLPLGSPTMDCFPHGTCGDASPLLAQYLNDRGLGIWTYHSGDRYLNGLDQSHAWIEQDGLIADITADQFNEGLGTVTVTYQRDWYNHFSSAIDDDRPALLECYDVGTRYRLSELYERILAFESRRESWRLNHFQNGQTF